VVEKLVLKHSWQLELNETLSDPNHFIFIPAHGLVNTWDGLYPWSHQILTKGTEMTSHVLFIFNQLTLLIAPEDFIKDVFFCIK
jgi:hypothetical protein